MDFIGQRYFFIYRAEYGNRTRLPGLGSPCTTDVLIPQNHRADTGTRTRDPRITNALLYQLSHIGNSADAKLNYFSVTAKQKKNKKCHRNILPAFPHYYSSVWQNQSTPYYILNFYIYYKLSICNIFKKSLK